jgi:hypothetical protein
MKIPIYDEPQVSTTPLATPLDTTDKTGAYRALAGMGQAIGSAVSKLHEDDEAMLKKQRSQDDAAAVLAAENSLHKDVDMAMNDRDIGLLNQQGEKAVQMSAHIYDRLETMRAQKVQQFGLSPEQAQAFKLRSAGMLEDTYRQGETYVAHQRRASNQADVDAAQTLTLNSIAQFSNDDELVARSTARVESGIRSQAISPAAGDAAVSEWRSKVAQTVLNSRISGRDIQGAQTYFDQPDVRASLGPAAAHYEKTIQLLGDQVRGVTQATDIVNGARRPVTGFVDETKVQEALSKIPPGPGRQTTEEEIRKQVALAHQGETDTVNTKFSGALTAYLGDHSLSDIKPEDKAWLQQYAPEKWVALEALQQRDINRAREPRGREAGDSPEQEAARIDAIHELTDNRDYWAKQPTEAFLAKYAPVLSKRGLHEVGGYFAKLHGTPGKADAPMPAPAAQAVRALMVEALHLPAKASQWSESQVRAAAHLQDYVTQKRSDFMHSNGGKEPTREQMQSWASDQLVKGKVVGSGRFFDDTTTRAQYETDPKYRGKNFAPKEGGPAEGVPATPHSAPSPNPVRQKGKDGNTYEFNPATKGWRKVG